MCPTTARGGYGLSIAETNRRLTIIEAVFTILPNRPMLTTNGASSVTAHAVQGKQVHDARLVALMQTRGITHILTLNASDFTRYPGIVAISPTSLVPSTPQPDKAPNP